MDDDEDSARRAGGEPGARPTERPGEEGTAPPRLVALARLVDLAGDPAGGARALRYEERIRAGEIVAHGRPRDHGLFVRHEPIPLEAWAGLVIEWTAGRAVPAEHLRPNSSAEPVWTDLHIPCDVVLDDPTPGGDAAGDHLLVTLADARSLAWCWRQAAAVPPDFPWEPEEFFLARPDQWRDLVKTTAGALAEAVRDGRLPARVGRMGEPVPASAWRATNRRADLDAGRLNLGSPSAGLTRLAPGEAGTGWAVALVRLGDLRRWYDETWPAPRPVAAEEGGGRPSVRADIEEAPVPRAALPAPRVSRAALYSWYRERVRQLGPDVQRTEKEE